ncbi:MAG: MarR family winged helix-turn-helix transcriptional regulator [Solirubrobacterales bacterium]|nr:MarR family winged helix-turn-helix transcriptional regulator [Solirubrobacterales bacterium]
MEQERCRQRDGDGGGERERCYTPGSMVLLTRLAKQVYRRTSEELLGMPLRHLMTLSYLRDHDGAPQQELAEAFCMDANNVVLLLNELEDLGQIARRRDPADRRRHRVELTAAGRAALAGAERAQESIEHEVLGALDPEERATLWRLLTRALYGSEAASPTAAGAESELTPAR